MYQMVYNLQQLDSISDYIISLIDYYDIFLFNADIGIGKTTLIKNIFKNVGIKDNINSPTFNYLNIYKGDIYTFCHFDLYRLKSYSDFVNMGFHEFLLGYKSFIEWPSILKVGFNLSDFKFVDIDIKYKDSSSRIINIDY